jgi:hypothetical protein
MADKIDGFIAEVRSRPEFIAGAASDPSKLNDLAALEVGLSAIERGANSDPALIDTLDEIELVISRHDLSIKQRLLAIGMILARVRDAGRSVH